MRFLWPAMVSVLAAVNVYAADPMKLAVDARDAARRILHAKATIPAAPGKLTLVFPKWIPGTHAPTGPVTELTGLKITAAGQTLAWQRDAEDMYAFHVEVPEGATTVEASYDSLIAPSDEDWNAWSAATVVRTAIYLWRLPRQ